MQWMLNHFISFDFINLYNNLLKETYCLSWVVEETETEWSILHKVTQLSKWWKQNSVSDLSASQSLTSQPKNTWEKSVLTLLHKKEELDL